MPGSPFFQEVPQWAVRALAEVARDAPEQLPAALGEAVATLRASPGLAGLTMRQLVTALISGPSSFGYSGEIVAAVDALGGVTATVAAGEAALAGEIAVAGTAVVATEAASGGAAGTGILGWIGGLSAGALTLGALAIGGIIIGGVIWYRGSQKGCACELPVEDPPVSGVLYTGGGKPAPVASLEAGGKGAGVSGPATAAATCGPLVATAHLCPGSPQGAEAKACGPGFCWDGGYNHSLACKQEVLPANAHRTYTNGVACDAGFTAAVDTCTNVVTACKPK